MQVTVNGVEVDLSSSGVRTLGEVIGAVQGAAAEKNEVVVEVFLNGEPLGPEQEAAQSGQELGPDDRVEVTVQDAVALLTGALQVTRDSLPELQHKLGHVAAALQSGSRQEAFSLFSECLTHGRQVVQLLQVSQTCLGFDPAQVTIEGKSLNELNEALLRSLQGTKEAMEQGDLVSLSDLLEYELAENIRLEDAILDRLIDMVPDAD